MKSLLLLVLVFTIHVEATEKKPTIARPSNVPVNATAKCNDGTYWIKSSTRFQTCNHHKGVQVWYK